MIEDNYQVYLTKYCEIIEKIEHRYDKTFS